MPGEEKSKGEVKETGRILEGGANERMNERRKEGRKDAGGREVRKEAPTPSSPLP